jgi:hypothetical protein
VKINRISLYVFIAALCVLLVPPFAVRVLALDLSWMPDSLDSLGPLKIVVGLLVGGSLGTAGAVALVFVLDLPVVREAVGGFLWGVGKAMSYGFIRWFGVRGKMIENKLQRFFSFCGQRLYAGLDSDDKKT